MKSNVKGYHLIVQMEMGVNARKVSEAIAIGEEEAELIKEVFEKRMPIGKVDVFLKRPAKKQ